MNLTKEEKFVRDEIAKIYDQLVINCYKTCKEGYDRWGHDLLPLCIEMFLQKNIKDQLKIISDGKLENYITFMMGRQLKSTSSRFWHQYRKALYGYRELYINLDYDIDPEFPKPFEEEEDLVITCMKKIVDDLDPFEKMVYNEHIINKAKYIELARKYDIPYYTFKETAVKIKNQLKNKCKHLL